MILPFPMPPAAVTEAAKVLEYVHAGEPEDRAQFGDLAELSRPWLPSTCPPVLRAHLWRWVDAAVDWINETHAWRPSTMIPGCWPHHRHLVAELPPLLFLRVAAEEALTPGLLDEWQRYALPAFMDRLAAQLGETPCRNGRHGDWPAAARFDGYVDNSSRADRVRIFAQDAGHV